MIVEFIQAPAICLPDRDVMFALMDQHFENMKRSRFDRDLDEKHWVVLVKDTGQVVGFTTVRLIETRLSSCKALVIYSGDTLVSPTHRMGTAFVRGWFAAMRYLQKTYSDRALYWFLLCSGFRTYRFMPVYWKEFFPRYDSPTPTSWQKDLDDLADRVFGEAYHRDSGIVRFTHPQFLRAHFRDIPPGREIDPNIEFFSRRNPDHVQGDELVCLTRICRENLTNAGMRFWYSSSLSFEVIHHESAVQNG